ncbi:serine--pyruvate aminotransferase, mitochondrial-like [Patiria miniata]|uniref:Alanine--glyoxylate aminotransferase n=1 Tax=Patiria miniata TaxID=46514 RepID=A0A914ACH3_PATMI|nr:serine--pyruvate aminotransferase, mitochondrial-like [Patiria miniata]
MQRKLQISPSKELLMPINVPQKLLMGPGPSNAPPRILAAGALPMLGHMHPEFVKVMDDVKAGIQYAFQTRNELTLAVSGTGHAGMEAATMNILEPGDTILVAEKGLWGKRLADLGNRNGANVKIIKKPMGQVFSLLEIENGLRRYNPSVFFITQGESSGTALQPLEGVGELCHRYNCLLFVDTVASLGGVPLLVDEWGIDVIYSGSQKVLGAPPGTAPISFSMKAREKMARRKTRVPSFYLDMVELGNYWGCDESPRRYHHTGMIHSVYALREGLAMLAEEGLENCWVRHRQCAEMLWAGLEKLGLKLLVTDRSARLPTVTGVMVPQGVAWKEVTQYMMDKYKIEISGGLGALAGKIWRIGLLGHNCQPYNVEKVLIALKEALSHCGMQIPASKL